MIGQGKFKKLNIIHSGFQALVYDMIEPFRWLVDDAVYKIANHKDSRKRIKLNELALDRSGVIRMNYVLIRRGF